MLYLINYDLRGNETPADYDRIATALRALGAKKVLLSTWVLRRNGTSPAALRDHLQKGVVDANDRVLVVEFSNWGSYNAMIDINNV